MKTLTHTFIYFCSPFFKIKAEHFQPHIKKEAERTVSNNTFWNLKTSCCDNLAFLNYEHAKKTINTVIQTSLVIGQNGSARGIWQIPGGDPTPPSYNVWSRWCVLKHYRNKKIKRPYKYYTRDICIILYSLTKFFFIIIKPDSIWISKSSSLLTNNTATYTKFEDHKTRQFK